MKNISDEDLTLLFYGEHNDPGLAASVAASPELSARYDTLCAELKQVDDFLPPERGDDYGADVWRQVAPRLASEQGSGGSLWTNILFVFQRPVFSLSGALALALVATLAFMLGRQGNIPVSPDSPLLETTPAVAVAELSTGRLLTSSVSDHLEQLNLALTQFMNLPETSVADAGRATAMLVANRLYRHAAISQGNHRLASFLSELEPLLIELAYEAHKASPTTRDRMQQEIRDSLLFRVRVMHKQLNSSLIST